MSEVFQTERLIVRTFRLEDVQEFFKYRTNPDIVRYQSFGRNFGIGKAKKFVKEQSQIEIGKIGSWTQLVIEKKKDRSMIGDCGIKINDEGSQAEFGITINLSNQKNGYGYEVLVALFTFCFERLNLQRIIAITDTENVGSIKLQEKLGMRKEGHFVKSYFDQLLGWRNEYQYAILREEWIIH